jgi:5-methylcytosine-specific restriction protein A
VSRAMQICSEPGCPEPVTSGRCAKHRAEKAKRDRRPAKSQRGYGARWNAIRAKQLKREPLCECDDCREWPRVMRKKADTVDHIVPINEGGTDDDNNLRSYFRDHHSRHTAKRSPGGINAVQKRDRLRAPVGGTGLTNTRALSKEATVYSPLTRRD